jgi:hypothetical protein
MRELPGETRSALVEAFQGIFAQKHSNMALVCILIKVDLQYLYDHNYWSQFHQYEQIYSNNSKFYSFARDVILRWLSFFAVLIYKYF